MSPLSLVSSSLPSSNIPLLLNNSIILTFFIGLRTRLKELTSIIRGKGGVVDNNVIISIIRASKILELEILSIGSKGDLEIGDLGMREGDFYTY